MFFEKLVKINFGRNDILHSLITELEHTLNHILLHSALTHNLALHVHFHINRKGQPLNIGIERRHLDQFRGQHVVDFVRQVDRSGSLDELAAVDVFEVL
jgi:hypothetical protein